MSCDGDFLLPLRPSLNEHVAFAERKEALNDIIAIISIKIQFELLLASRCCEDFSPKRDEECLLMANERSSPFSNVISIPLMSRQWLVLLIATNINSSPVFHADTHTYLFRFVRRMAFVVCRKKFTSQWARRRWGEKVLFQLREPSLSAKSDDARHDSAEEAKGKTGDFLFTTCLRHMRTTFDFEGY